VVKFQNRGRRGTFIHILTAAEAPGEAGTAEATAAE
jgi:hypothetical protein